MSTEASAGPLSAVTVLELGTLIAGPMKTEMGRVAAVSDPQGAAFALFEGDVDP